MAHARSNGARSRGDATNSSDNTTYWAVIAAITAVVATDQRTEAQSQRNRAEAEAARATAKSLASQATALTGTDATLSLLLAAEGYRLDQSLDTESGLLTALNGARLLTSLSTPLPDDVSDLAVSPNRSALYVLTLSGAPIGCNVVVEYACRSPPSVST